MRRTHLYLLLMSYLLYSSVSPAGHLPTNYRSSFYQNLLLDYEDECFVSDYLWNLPTHSCVNKILERFSHEYPDFVRVRQIGQSVDGRIIYAARIGTTDNFPDGTPKPVMLAAGSIHANEFPGTVILLDWIDMLLNSNNANLPLYPSTLNDPYYHYFTNSSYANTFGEILEERVLWIVPIINPDRYPDRRVNVNGVNLARDGFYRWQKNTTGPDPNQYTGDYPLSQPETRAITQFAESIRPNVYVEIHGYRNGIKGDDEDSVLTLVGGEEFSFSDGMMDGFVGATVPDANQDHWAVVQTFDKYIFYDGTYHNSVHQIPEDNEFFHYLMRDDANFFPSLTYLSEISKFDDGAQGGFTADALGLAEMDYFPYDNYKVVPLDTSSWTGTSPGSNGQTIGHMWSLVGATSFILEVKFQNFNFIDDKNYDGSNDSPSSMLANFVHNPNYCLKLHDSSACDCADGNCRCIDNDLDGDCDCIDFDGDSDCDIDPGDKVPIDFHTLCNTRCLNSPDCNCLDKNLDTFWDAIDYDPTSTSIFDGLEDSYIYPHGDYCNGDGNCACIDVDPTNGVDCDCIDYNGDGYCEMRPLEGSRYPSSTFDFDVWKENRSDAFIRMVIEDHFYPLNKILLTADNPLPGTIYIDKVNGPFTSSSNLAVTSLSINHDTCNINFLTPYWAGKEESITERNGYYGLLFSDITCSVSNYGNASTGAKAFNVFLDVYNLDSKSYEAQGCQMINSTNNPGPYSLDYERTGGLWRDTYEMNPLLTKCLSGDFWGAFEEGERYAVTCRWQTLKGTTIPGNEKGIEVIEDQGCKGMGDEGIEVPYYCELGNWDSDSDDEYKVDYPTNNAQTTIFKAVLNPDPILDFECDGNGNKGLALNLNGYPVGHIPAVTGGLL